MKIAAIVANAAQLIIILAIFFIRGVDLGVLVIVLLFLLMSVPFINFLAIFISYPKLPAPDLSESEKNGLIKRESMRIRYPDENCPTLKTGDTSFAVRDLSEGGVRIRAGQSTRFKKKVNGEIQLLGGDRILFRATLMRREEGEAVFQFIDPIGTAPLIEEKKAMAAVKDGEPKD